MVYTDKCPQCGFIHPPVALGQCPIANQKRIQEDSKDKQVTAIYNLSTQLQKEFIEKCKKITDPIKINDFLQNSIKYIRSYTS